MYYLNYISVVYITEFYMNNLSCILEFIVIFILLDVNMKFGGFQLLKL